MYELHELEKEIVALRKELWRKTSPSTDEFFSDAHIPLARPEEVFIDPEKYVSSQIVD